MGTRLFIISQLIVLLASSVAYADGGCAKDPIGRVFCAPPGGGAHVNPIGQVMCGPGQCEVNPVGQVYCSSQSGGGATVNNMGQPVCVGGCVLGSSSYCQNPASGFLQPNLPMTALPASGEGGPELPSTGLTSTLNISPEQWEKYKHNYDLQFPNSSQAIRDRELEEQHKQQEKLPPGWSLDDSNGSNPMNDVTTWAAANAALAKDKGLQLVGTTKDAAVYAMPSTIRKAGKKVKVWYLFDYMHAISSATGEPPLPSDTSRVFLSVKEQYEFDCREEQMRDLYTNTYSGNMGYGEVVYTNEKPSEMVPLIPESVGEAMWNFVCRKRLAR